MTGASRIASAARLGALGMAVVIAALVCFVTRAYPAGQACTVRLLTLAALLAGCALAFGAALRARAAAGACRPGARCRSRPARSPARTSRCTPRTRSRACASSRARSRPRRCWRSRRRRAPWRRDVNGARPLAALAALLGLVAVLVPPVPTARARRRRHPGGRGLHAARAGRLAHGPAGRCSSSPTRASRRTALPRRLDRGPVSLEGRRRHGRGPARAARGRLRLARLALGRAGLPRAGARGVPVPRPRDRLAAHGARPAARRAARAARSRSGSRPRCCWCSRRSCSGVTARSRSCGPRPSRRRLVAAARPPRPLVFPLGRADAAPGGARRAGARDGGRVRREPLLRGLTLLVSLAAAALACTTADPAAAFLSAAVLAYAAFFVDRHREGSNPGSAFFAVAASAVVVAATLARVAPAPAAARPRGPRPGARRARPLRVRPPAGGRRPDPDRRGVRPLPAPDRARSTIERRRSSRSSSRAPSRTRGGGRWWLAVPCGPPATRRRRSTRSRRRRRSSWRCASGSLPRPRCAGWSCPPCSRSLAAAYAAFSRDRAIGAAWQALLLLAVAQFALRGGEARRLLAAGEPPPATAFALALLGAHRRAAAARGHRGRTAARPGRARRLGRPAPPPSRAAWRPCWASSGAPGSSRRRSSSSCWRRSQSPGWFSPHDATTRRASRCRRCSARAPCGSSGGRHRAWTASGSWTSPASPCCSCSSSSGAIGTRTSSRPRCTRPRWSSGSAASGASLTSRPRRSSASSWTALGWAGVGAVACALGLVRREPTYRLLGLAILAAALARTVGLGPDLPTGTRVASAAAIGLCALALGFAYERLSDRRPEEVHG